METRVFAVAVNLLKKNKGYLLHKVAKELCQITFNQFHLSIIIAKFSLPNSHKVNEICSLQLEKNDCEFVQLNFAS